MNDSNDPNNLEVLQPSAIEAINRAEVDIAISTARRFPRELHKVKQRMITFATLDEATAASCFYTLPRGGKNIEGPSVRLAEIALSCYTNLRAGTRIISTVTTGDTPHVVVQAVATDMENNITISIEKRRRITKKKSKDYIDEDDINLATNACSSIAFRDAVFRIVPLALVKPVFEAARKVAIGDARTLGDRRAKSMETFSKMGISKERVLAKLEKKSIEDVDLGDIEIMLGLYNAIKEGEIKLDDAFPQLEQTKGPDFGTQTTAKRTPETPKTAEAPKTPPTAQKVQEKAPEPPKPTETAPADGPSDAEIEAKMGLAPETAKTEPEPERKTESAPEPATPTAPAEADPKLAEKPGDTEALANVKYLGRRDGITHTQLMGWARAGKFAKEGQSLQDLSEAKLVNIGSKWDTILPKIKEQSK